MSGSGDLDIGLTESIVAAAASRVGKTVLHIDANDYYGGQWASFNLENIQSFVSATESAECVIENAEYRWTHESVTSTTSENGTDDSSSGAAGGDDAVVDKNKSTAEGVVWTKAKVLSEFRKFNIDLTPKVRSTDVTHSQSINVNSFRKCHISSCCLRGAIWLNC